MKEGKKRREAKDFAKDFVLYPIGTGEPLKVFEDGNDLLRSL